MSLFWGWAIGNGHILRVGEIMVCPLHLQPLTHPLLTIAVLHKCMGVIPILPQSHQRGGKKPILTHDNKVHEEPGQSLCVQGRLQTYEKMKLRPSQGSNMGLLDADQMLLPTEPPKLWAEDVICRQIWLDVQVESLLQGFFYFTWRVPELLSPNVTLTTLPNVAAQSFYYWPLSCQRSPN